jgi:hypothetical protein
MSTCAHVGHLSLVLVVTCLWRLAFSLGKVVGAQETTQPVQALREEVLEDLDVKVAVHGSSRHGGQL